jgi:hypothetical protein
MLMRSEAFASDLYAPRKGYRLEDYCRRHRLPYAPIGMRLPLETFVDYGMWFQSQLVGHVREREVSELRQLDGGFRLSLDDGSTLLARRVVIALGLKGFERTPPLLEGLPRPYAMHSGEIGDLSWSRGKRIAIVGGGQSALGLAALFHELGAQVRVLSRDAGVTWNADPDPARSLVSRILNPEGGLAQGWYPYMLSEFPFLFRLGPQGLRRHIAETSFGPSGAWWLRDRVTGKVEIMLGTTVQAAEVRQGEVVLHASGERGMSTVTADHLVVATGFRVDLARHAFLTREIVDGLALLDGWPDVDRHFESAVSGLYVTGPAAALSFGPALRFVYGARYAAPCIARHIARRHAAQPANLPLPGAADGKAAGALPGAAALTATENHMD